jgi:hypothetical protein
MTQPKKSNKGPARPAGKAVKKNTPKHPKEASSKPTKTDKVGTAPARDSADKKRIAPVTEKQRKNSEAEARRLTNLKPFQPGQSGNPNGRPKSSLTSILREQLQKEDPAGPEKQSFAESIVRQVIEKAARGDLRAIELLWSRLEGKPVQPLDLEGGEAVNRRQWAQEKLEQIMREENLSWAEAVDQVKRHAPTVAGYLEL